jgi:hypothetical protein
MTDAEWRLRRNRRQIEDASWAEFENVRKSHGWRPAIPRNENAGGRRYADRPGRGHRGPPTSGFSPNR